ESSLDAIVVADAGSVIREWNGPAERTFGWSRREAIGRGLGETIIPPRYRAAHEAGVRRLLETGERRILGRRIEISALRRDGTEFPVELTVVAVELGPTPMFCSFIRDLTEERRSEQRLRVEHAVTRVLAEADGMEEAATRVLHAVG